MYFHKYRVWGNVRGHAHLSMVTPPNYVFFSPMPFQHRLKQSQRSKVRQFVTITGTDEHTAINCLSLNDWRIDAATDNFFTDPVRYFVEPPKAAVDKKKLDQLFNKYRSKLTHCLTVGKIGKGIGNVIT